MDGKKDLEKELKMRSDAIEEVFGKPLNLREKVTFVTASLVALHALLTLTCGSELRRTNEIETNPEYIIDSMETLYRSNLDFAYRNYYPIKS